MSIVAKRSPISATAELLLNKVSTISQDSVAASLRRVESLLMIYLKVIAESHTDGEHILKIGHHLVK